jgi:BolA protein
MTVADRIEQKLAALSPAALEVVDESRAHAGHEGAKSGGGHFRLLIVSPEFTGKTTQLRHRMVYEALGPMMKHEIHALAIRAYAPGEF